LVGWQFVAEWSLAPSVTAEIGLRAGDEMAATLMGIDGVVGSRMTSGPVRTLSFEQRVRRLRTWGEPDGLSPATPLRLDQHKTSSQVRSGLIFTIRI
jgi:hypothetical protein